MVSFHAIGGKRKPQPKIVREVLDEVCGDIDKLLDKGLVFLKILNFVGRYCFFGDKLYLCGVKYVVLVAVALYVTHLSNHKEGVGKRGKRNTVGSDD